MGEVIQLRRPAAAARPIPHVGAATGWARALWLAAVGLVLVLATTRDGVTQPLFSARFGGPGRLLSNEFATYHPDARGAVTSDQWIVTSGSLFVHDGEATNGPLDRSSPNAGSTNGTDSAVFRAYTRQKFRGDYRVTFDLRVSAPQAVSGVPANSWDGVHLITNAQSPAAAYYVSLYRRDGHVVVKKKTAGGAVAGGTYRSLSHYAPTAVTVGTWAPIRLDVRRSQGGAITLDLYEDGHLVTSATDDRQVSGSAPFEGGRLGLRADNTTFTVREFRVSPL